MIKKCQLCQLDFDSEDTLCQRCRDLDQRKRRTRTELPFAALTGLVLEKLVQVKGSRTINEEVYIWASGRKFVMVHDQDCCECVTVEDIQGNVERMIGEVVIDATENSNCTDPKIEGTDDCWTWTYYTIRTQSETLVIRWYGSSNGYYSESVTFYEEKETA